MARIRTIKPEFWQDDDLAEVSETALLFAIGLLNHADDDGYFKANPKLIESVVFPLREPSVTTTVAIQELSSIGYITLYHGKDGKQYGKVNGFKNHQRINKPTPSKIKDLIDFSEDYVTPTVALRTGKERKGKEQGKEVEGNGGGKDLMSCKQDESEKIIDILNNLSGKKFEYVDANKKLIRARIKEGHTTEKIEAVVYMKCKEWINDPKFKKYLRPATLFNAEKFNQYVGELGVETPEDEEKRKINEWLTEGEVYEH